jgi:hypothetical protein
MHLILTQISSTIQDTVRSNLDGKSSATAELRDGTEKEVQLLMQDETFQRDRKKKVVKIRLIA